MTIEINGMDELILKLARLERMDAVKAVMRSAAEYLKGKLAKYPTQRSISRESVYGAPFASERQRRFFFAALHDGEIDVPYHRGESASSEAFGRSWTISEQDEGLTQIVGNDTSYGPMVMGDDQSQFMAAMGWEKASDIADNETDVIVNFIKTAIDRECES